MILEAEADLVPMGPRSPLRSGRRRADIPWMSCAPSSAWLRLLWGRCPWFKVSPPARSLQNRRPPGRLATRLPQGFGYCVAGAHGSKVSALLRSAQSRHPPDVLRSPLRSGRCRTDVPRTSCNPSSAWLRLLWGRRPWFKVSALHSIFRVKMG